MLDRVTGLNGHDKKGWHFGKEVVLELHSFGATKNIRNPKTKNKDERSDVSKSQSHRQLRHMSQEPDIFEKIMTSPQLCLGIKSRQDPHTWEKEKHLWMFSQEERSILAIRVRPGILILNNIPK